MGQQNMRERLDNVERKLDTLSASVDQRFDAVERRFDRLEAQSKLQVEQFGDLVQRAAEGYGATLEHINRRLGEIHESVTRRLHDHDIALENHATRITTLEQR